MHPFIRPGDRVEVLPTEERENQEIRTGECVVFRDRGQRWLLHRVIGRAPGTDRIRTKGDALLQPDFPVEKSLIRGRVIKIERAATGRIYRLDRFFPRELGRVIALFSRLEAAARNGRVQKNPDGRRGFFFRLLQSPRQILTRVFFP